MLRPAQLDPQQAQRRSQLLGAVAIAAITFLAYIPVFGAGFIWDDDGHVLHTPQQTSLRGLRDLWNPRLHLMPQYYPITHTTFWIEYHLWGTWPLGYHLVNVALHATSAILIWLLLRRLEVPGAFVAAMVFAVHPVHVESVAWVSERKNTLSCVLYLLAAITYLRSVGGVPNFTLSRYSGSGQGEGLSQERTPIASEEGPRPDPLPAYRERGQALKYALATLLFIAAVLSKSVTCTLPAAVLVVVWWKRGTIRARDVLPLVPWFAIAVVAGLNTAAIERGTVGAADGEWAISPAQRVLIAGRAVWFYAAKLVVPWPLSFNYERWDVASNAPAQWVFPFALVIALLTLAILTRRRTNNRGALAAVLIYIGTLFPALGFFNLYPMRFSFVADHFQYHASIAMIALIAAVLWQAIPQLPRRPVFAILILALAAMTFVRATAFHDAETLWRDTIDKTPTAWMPYANLGKLLADEDRNEEAAGALARSLELNADQAEAHLILGDLLLKLGDPFGALAQYRQAAERRPRNFRAHEAVGKALLARDDLAGARREYERAIELEPRFVQGRATLASILYRLSEANHDPQLLDEAIAQMRRAIELLPDDATLHNNLGVYLEARGQLNDALNEYETALRLRPDYAQAAVAASRLRGRLGGQK